MRCTATILVNGTARRCRWGHGHLADGSSLIAFHSAEPIGKGAGRILVAWTDGPEYPPAVTLGQENAEAVGLKWGAERKVPSVTVAA